MKDKNDLKRKKKGKAVLLVFQLCTAERQRENSAGARLLLLRVPAYELDSARVLLLLMLSRALV